MENQHSGLALMQKRPKRHSNTFYEAVMSTKQIINRGCLLLSGLSLAFFSQALWPAACGYPQAGYFFRNRKTAMAVSMPISGMAIAPEKKS
ncbi:hypothetical protein NB703_000352 [Pantoea ananatis]|uniref:Uncharacterized protein n=1 Tax=Pantoea ananas TaxID=553 RepID=A0AAJ1CVE1_PANAN|nr:hypothetical protein [Pantoea ananatis]